MNDYQTQELTRPDDRLIAVDDLDGWTDTSWEDVRAGIIMTGATQYIDLDSYSE